MVPPESPERLLQQDRPQKRDRLLESFGRVCILVLVLDREHVVVADQAQGADEVAPERLAVPVADGPERPRPPAELRVGLRVENPVEPDVVGLQTHVLRVDVIDGVAQHPQRLQHVDPLPDQMRRVEVQTEVLVGDDLEELPPQRR